MGFLDRRAVRLKVLGGNFSGKHHRLGGIGSQQNSFISGYDIKVIFYASTTPRISAKPKNSLESCLAIRMPCRVWYRSGRNVDYRLRAFSSRHGV